MSKETKLEPKLLIPRAVISILFRTWLLCHGMRWGQMNWCVPRVCIILVTGYTLSVSVPIIIIIFNLFIIYFTLSWVTDFVQRLQRTLGARLTITSTKPPFLPYLPSHQDRGGWNKPKFTEGIKVSLRREKKYSEAVEPLFAKHKRGSVFLGKRSTKPWVIL